jgi:hypothetical protein
MPAFWKRVLARFSSTHARLTVKQRFGLATVLRHHGFGTKLAGDRIEALLGKRPFEEIRQAVLMVGRLMVASRHLDMLMDSQATAEAYAAAFIAGDYGFELARDGLG